MPRNHTVHFDALPNLFQIKGNEVHADQSQSMKTLTKERNQPINVRPKLHLSKRRSKIFLKAADHLHGTVLRKTEGNPWQWRLAGRQTSQVLQLRRYERILIAKWRFWKGWA